MVRRRWIAGMVALGAAMLVGLPGPGTAHEAQCPVCKLDVVQDTETTDNEVAIRFGRKRIEYRCLQCALQDAPSYRGDVTILAPSEVKGKPVLIQRKEGAWSVQPADAVFLSVKSEHRDCWIANRAFATRAGFEKWKQAHPALLKEAEPLALRQVVERKP
jgi:hypothetical protein